MKKIYALLIIITILMAACRQTPEELIVQNKADNEFKEAAAQTAKPESELPHATGTPELKIHLEAASSNESGTVSVNILAEVIQPDISQIPVAYVEPIEFTQNQIDKIIKAFYGSTTFCDPNVATKTELETNIVRLRKSATDLNSDLAQSNGADNLEDLKKIADEWIAALEKQWQSAPDEHPQIDTSNITQNEHFLGKTYMEGKDDMAYLFYVNRAPFQYIHCIAFGGKFNSQLRKLKYYSSTPIDLDDTQYNEEKQLAEDLIEKAGIENVKLAGAYISMDNMGLFADGVEQKAQGVIGDREYSVFCYERTVGEGTLDDTFYEGTRSETQYSEPLPYEKIQVWLEDGKIVQFIWESPIEVTETVNENAQMQIEYLNAAELATRHAFVKYAGAWPDIIKDAVLDIDKIEFALVRIREINSGSFIVVPAWKFYGEIKGHLTQEAINSPLYSDSTDYVPLSGWLTPMDSRNLITINALDGTVIDMELGY